MPTAQTRLARGRLEERSLSALVDRGDRCQDVFVRRLLASAGERWLPLCEVHQLFGVLSDAAKMVNSFLSTFFVGFSSPK